MKKIIALLLTLAIVFCATACTQAPSTEPAAEPAAKPAEEPAEKPAAEPAAQTGEAAEEWSLGIDTIKIGYVGALTGPSSAMGQSARDGAQLAIDEINAAGGIGGAKLELIYRDDEADPTKDLTGVEELIYKENINMLYGAPNSACAAASLDTVTENKIIEFLCTATAANLIDAKKYPYTFRATSTNDLQAESLVQMAKDGGYSKIVAFGDTSALGVDGFESTKKYAEQYGVEIAEYISYTADDADLSSVANKIKSSGADLALAWALGADAAKIIKALERVDYLDKLDVIGYSGLYNQAFLELVADMECPRVTYLGCSPWTIPQGADKLEGKTQEFYDKFTATYGEYKTDGSGRTSIESDANKAYECMYLYKYMIEKTQSIDPDVIKEAIENYSSEYKINSYESEGYLFTAENHEGYAAKDMAKCTMEEKLVNEHVFGDMPWRAK